MSDQQLALERLRRETELGTIDLRAQMRDAKNNFAMGRDEAERQYGTGKKQLGQSMSSRGLGWSGLRTGAEGRQLADFTAERGAATLGHQQERDALKRALQYLRADAALQEKEIMRSSQSSQGLA